MRSRISATSCSHCRRSVGSVEHSRHDRAAVRRRIRIVGACHSLDVAQRRLGLLAALGATKRERADTLVVETKVLGIRAGHQHAFAALRPDYAARRHPLPRPSAKP